jgi:drug/metabolite transporter (DMT)-like permease
MSQRSSAFPVLVLAFGVLAVSTASIFIRNAQLYAPSLTIAAWRLGLATLALAPLALTPRRRAELAGLTRLELGLAALSGFFLALHFATWISSLEYTSVASSVVLVDTAPLWVALLAPWTLGERLRRPALVGMLLAVFGGAVVGISDACGWTQAGLACPPLSEFVAGRAFWGDLLALAGAVTAALYLVIGRKVRERVSLVAYIFVVYGVAALVLIAIMLAAGQAAFGPPGGFPPVTYLWLLALALIPQVLGHSTYNWALGYLPAAYVSIALLGEPIGSTLLAMLFLNEMPASLKIVGAALILVGIYAAARPSAPRPRA